MDKGDLRVYMQYNNIVSSATLLFNKQSETAGKLKLIHRILQPLDRGELISGDGVPVFPPEARAAADQIIARAVEAYVRLLVAHCAVTVRLPDHRSFLLPPAGDIKRALPPSLKKRVRFVDRRRHIWNAITKYFAPVAEFLDEKNAYLRSEIDQVKWDVCLLAVASRTRSQVISSPHEALRILRELQTVKALSSEAKARIATLVGMFQSYDTPTEVPGFRVLPLRGSVSLADRVEDILDDAYLLEASHLRRLLGLRANVASIRRDLRSLLRFIAKRRKWAKGVLSAANYAGVLGAEA